MEGVAGRFVVVDNRLEDELSAIDQPFENVAAASGVIFQADGRRKTG